MAFAAAVFGGPAERSPADVAACRAKCRSGGCRSACSAGLAFAQALAHQPDLLILDEPTSGVDPLGRARLWQTIGDAAAAGAGVLVSTHYMEEADECDRLIIMADGEVVAAGTARRIVGDAQVTVVEASDWAAAFARLEDPGLDGRARRPGPPGARRARRGAPALRRACRAGAGGIRPATLEERFFELG